MRGGIRAWRHIELKAQIAHVDRLHLAGGIVVEVVGNARYLCLNGSSIHEEVVRVSHQFMLLVGMVPITALNDMTGFVIFRHIARIPILHIDDEGVARHLLHTIAIQIPTLLHVSSTLAPTEVRENS